MQKWEYLRLHAVPLFDKDGELTRWHYVNTEQWENKPEDIEDMLNTAGLMGWELVANYVDNSYETTKGEFTDFISIAAREFTFVFKRPIENKIEEELTEENVKEIQEANGQELLEFGQMMVDLNK
jgi:hypothetical protein